MPSHSETGPMGALAGYRVLQRLSVSVRSQVDLRRVLDTLVSDACRLMDLRLCSLARWEASGSRMVFSHEHRRDQAPSSASLIGLSYCPGATPETRAFDEQVFKQQGEVVLDGRSAHLGQVPFMAGLSESVAAIVPIVGDQRVLGLLVAARSRELRGWQDGEMEFLDAASALAGVAIQHAALRSCLRVISAAAAELNSSISLPALMRRLTEAAMSVTQSAMGLAGLREGERMLCREVCRDGVWQPLERRFDKQRGLAGWSWTNRAPCIANDTVSDRRADAGFVCEQGIRTALAIPVVDRRGEVLGFFELCNKAGGASYGEADVHLVSALSHHAALALELRGAAGGARLSAPGR